MTLNAALALELERLTEFLYLVPVGLALVDPEGDVVAMNAAGAQLLMPLTAAGDLSNVFDVLAPYAPDLRSLVGAHTAARGAICEGRRLDLRAMGRARGPHYLAVGLVRVDAERIMAVVQDITHTVEQERALFADEQRFRSICEGLRDSVICTLDGRHRVDSWNASGERLLGYVGAEVAGRQVDDVLCREGDALSFDRVRRSGAEDIEGWCARKDGSRFWGAGVVSALADEAGAVSGFSVVLRDATERRLSTDKLVELATKDALTGLANRRAFTSQADKEVLRRARYGAPFAVMMVDADRFKTVNDTHGHAAGDEVLRTIASILTSSVRATDLVARFGGDELAALLPETSAPGALALAERICVRVADALVHIGGEALHVTVSIGVAEASSLWPDLASLLAAADAALYRAKGDGRNRAALA